MRRTDLVIPVGAHQQQVAHVRVREQVFKQVECRGVQPLQIVEEQRERVLRRGEHAEEPSEHQLEAVLGIARRQVWHRRLLPDDEFHLRGQTGDQLAVRLNASISAQRHVSISASLLTRI